jgi:DNA-binding transcriptional MerR regulator
MKCDVSEFSARTDLSVDTIRYYQSIGILPPPEREGRRAFYDQSHLDRVDRIKAMAERGFSLKAILAVFEAGSDETSDRLLLGAIEESAESSSYSSAQLARELGLPKTVLSAVEKAGLAEPAPGLDGSRRYTASDFRVAAGAVKLIGYGFPFARLLKLAIRHDRAVRSTVDEAINLFDAQIRKADDKNEDPEAVAAAFKELLPVVSALIAHHFERVLVNRALKRLKKSGQRRAFKAALQATSAPTHRSGDQRKTD